MTYNPWPIGNVPEHLQRPELKQLKELGYQFNDPREVITLFENKVAKFAGSKYAVAVDCCTHALELSLRYELESKVLRYDDPISIPRHTYISCALMITQIGFELMFHDEEWDGMYRIVPSNVYDAAVTWNKEMYIKNSLFCLSFQIKKRIPIGKGGMVLTDDKEAADWIRLAAYDGRDLTTPYNSKEHIKLSNGRHYYMEPESAARGIILMDNIKEQGNTGNFSMYPNVEQMLNNVYER